jgi:uncharacterized protein YbaR (Trm112 family)
MEEWVRQALRCPTCQGELTDAPERLVCHGCGCAYPVRESIPSLIAGTAERLGDGE